MVRGIGQRNNRAIVGWRQRVIIYSAETLSSHSAKMKVPDGSRRISRQFVQHAEPIQNLLAVGLENFPSQAGWRPRRLLQHDVLDALLRQRKAEHGPAPACADNDHIRPFRHFQS
jgi:hypothetical protein